jgi:hypothetical protein
LRAKNEFADPGMKTVGSDDEIELTRTSTFKSDAYTVFILFHPIDAISEDRFDLIFDFAEDRCR